MKLALKSIVLTLFTIFLNSFLYGQAPVSDTLISQPKNICLSAADPEGNTWIVYGNDCDSISKLKPNKTLDISQRLHLPSGISYTCLLPLDRHCILLGTASNYVYMLRDRRFVRLDSTYGLTDSAIVAMRLDRDNQILYVQSENSTFVLHRGSTKKDFRFTKIQAGEPVKPDNSGVLRKRFRKPLQKAVCNAFSDIDLSFRKQKYIGGKELESITVALYPGDILIKRNDLQVSNIGIAGFWTHSGIYLGSTEQIDQYFAGIEMLGNQKASDYIRENYGEIYRCLQKHKPLIIEAIGEGVVINPLDHIARVDYFAALRPRLPREEIFRSLLIAFSHYGKPYDFLFDFGTDDALVCSELVFKSYCETPDKKGLSFIENSYEGKFFYYPTDFVRQFCLEHGSPDAAFSFVLFYDASLKEKNKVYGDFCNTLQRHKLF
ncbi:MAG TPA: YiiX/YebB-like N1pC/P60 family cysteine hydrolase [Bacteroidales bacterium]|nr:YiiX/YebB-like N1pC/P60 family cysteine hydrolase [Bacteroidales bacterium]